MNIFSKPSYNIFQAHQNNLNEKAKAMINVVNVAIGNSICLDIADISIETSGAGMFTQGNKVNKYTEFNNAVSVMQIHPGCILNVT